MTECELAKLRSYLFKLGGLIKTFEQMSAKIHPLKGIEAQRLAGVKLSAVHFDAVENATVDLRVILQQWDELIPPSR